MVNVFAPGGHELVTKDEVMSSKDLLKNAKWSKITYSGGKPQANDQRLSTQIIPINESLPVYVDFKASNEQINWDILGFSKADNNTANTDDSWQSESRIWYADYDWKANTTRTGIKYIAIVLNNTGKLDKVNCSLRVTQPINVIDYIKDNFSILKKQIGQAKGYVNPNLIQRSDKFALNGSNPLNYDFKMGQNIKSVVDNNSYAAVWAKSGKGNWGIEKGDSDYVQLESNTTYTFSAWIQCDGVLQSSPWGWYSNMSGAVKQKIMFNVVSLGKNEYKFYSTFTTPATDPTYAISYFAINSFFDTSKSFNFCYERMKLEVGAESTSWCPAPEELITKSDLDDLKAQIEQLKSK